MKYRKWDPKTKAKIVKQMTNVLYDEVSSGTDFTYYQDCNYNRYGSGYQEHYFNPDHVIVYPHNKEFIWFDLEYTAVGICSKSIRRIHSYGPHNYRKKFAFSNINNKMSIRRYSNLQSKIIRNNSELLPQKTKGYEYHLREKYRTLCNVESTGTIKYKTDKTIEDIWEKRYKIKIKVKLCEYYLIFPIRLSFLTKSTFSFTSKNVVIPDFDQPRFSWNNCSIGNISVCSDGTYSIWMENKSLSLAKTIIPQFFPRFSQYFTRVITAPELSQSTKMKKIIKRFPIIRKLFMTNFWIFFSGYLNSHSIRHGNTSFEILYAEI